MEDEAAARPRLRGSWHRVRTEEEPLTRRLRIDDLTALAVPEQPALSPDGGTLRLRPAYASTPTGDRSVRALWSVGVGEATARRSRAGRRTPRPRGRRTARGSRSCARQDGPPQVWLLPADGGEPEQLTTLPLGAGAPVWSPDGAADRVRRARRPRRRAGRGRRRPRASSPGADRRRPARLPGRRRGLPARGCASTSTSLDLETKDCRQADARRLARRRPGVVAGRDAARVRGGDGAGRRPAPSARRSTSSPRRTAVATGAGRARGRRRRRRSRGRRTGRRSSSSGTSDEPVGHARLLRLPLDGGEPVDLAAPLDRNVMPGGARLPGRPSRSSPATAARCSSASATAGCTHLYSVPLDGGEPSPVVTRRGPGRRRPVRRGRNGGRRDSPPRRSLRRDRHRRPRDGRRDGAAPSTAPTSRRSSCFPREEREFTISDGTVVHGWLVRDPEATQPQPLLLDIHGGPHNAWNGAADEIHLYHQELAARGWAVLLLNPRGSDGYGEDFYDGGARGLGRVPTRRTSSSRSTSSSRRASPTPSGSR